jgi:hypothetical protein
MSSEQEIEDRIKHVGNLFVDRLDKQIISSAVGYADFSEYGLAVEILCEQLIEEILSNLVFWDFGQAAACWIPSTNFLPSRSSVIC